MAQQLSNDAWSFVFRFLDDRKDLKAVAGTCRSFHSIIRSERRPFLCKLFYDYYPDTMPALELPPTEVRKRRAEDLTAALSGRIYHVRSLDPGRKEDSNVSYLRAVRGLGFCLAEQVDDQLNLWNTATDKLIASTTLPTGWLTKDVLFHRNELFLLLEQTGEATLSHLHVWTAPFDQAPTPILSKRSEAQSIALFREDLLLLTRSPDAASLEKLDPRLRTSKALVNLQHLRRPITFTGDRHQLVTFPREEGDTRIFIREEGYADMRELNPDTLELIAAEIYEYDGASFLSPIQLGDHNLWLCRQRQKIQLKQMANGEGVFPSQTDTDPRNRQCQKGYALEHNGDLTIVLTDRESKVSVWKPAKQTLIDVFRPEYPRVPHTAITPYGLYVSLRSGVTARLVPPPAPQPSSLRIFLQHMLTPPQRRLWAAYLLLLIAVATGFTNNKTRLLTGALTLVTLKGCEAYLTFKSRPAQQIVCIN